jgi:hypothetical protein
MIKSPKQFGKVLVSGRFLTYIFDSNKWRTLFAISGIFLPVSKRRWLVAQNAESHIWNLPETSSTYEHPSFLNEGIKSDFIIKNSLSAIGLTLEDLLKDRVVIDVGCGPASAILDSDSPKRKIGIDPMPFPSWVRHRYQQSGFELIIKPVEELIASDFREISKEIPLVIMYNALQHFKDPYMGLELLSELLKTHELLIIDYANAPADDAHPQVITHQRVSRMLNRIGYQIDQARVIEMKKDGLIEYGHGSAAQILLVKAMLVLDSEIH